MRNSISYRGPLSDHPPMRPPPSPRPDRGGGGRGGHPEGGMPPSRGELVGQKLFGDNKFLTPEFVSVGLQSRLGANGPRAPRHSAQKPSIAFSQLCTSEYRSFPGKLRMSLVSSFRVELNDKRLQMPSPRACAANSASSCAVDRYPHTRWPPRRLRSIQHND